MSEDRAVAHLEGIKQDIRDEIKRRIQQRDQYSMQMTIALGVLLAVSFSQYGSRKLLVLIPFVAIYFTVLILHSYRIHVLLASYLRTAIEPDLARLCSFPPEKEWEVSYTKQQMRGVRRWFFMIHLWAIPGLSLGYLWTREWGQGDQLFDKLLSWSTIIYTILILATTIWEFVPVHWMPRKPRKGEKI